MTHSIKTIARNHRLHPGVFLQYALLTSIAKEFYLDITDKDAFVSTWHCDGLVHAFKEFINARFLDYLKYRGYQPLSAKMEPAGFLARLDPEQVPDLAHFTSVDKNHVRLSFMDMDNIMITGQFDFVNGLRK